MTLSEVASIIDRVDTNKDGRLDYEEVRDGPKNGGPLNFIHLLLVLQPYSVQCGGGQSSSSKEDGEEPREFPTRPTRSDFFIQMAPCKRTDNRA